MEKESHQTTSFLDGLPPSAVPQLACLLCSQYIPFLEYERHMALHEQAEILADLLVLSRR